LFLIMISLTSCTHLEYASNGITPFKISTTHESERESEYSGSVDFYFWGMYPSKMTVNLEELAIFHGIDEPSYVSIEHSIGTKNMIFSLLSLGIYTPIDYKLKVLSRKVFKR
jgi:hypothetical protein